MAENELRETSIDKDKLNFIVFEEDIPENTSHEFPNRFFACNGWLRKLSAVQSQCYESKF